MLTDSERRVRENERMREKKPSNCASDDKLKMDFVDSFFSPSVTIFRDSSSISILLEFVKGQWSNREKKTDNNNSSINNQQRYIL